MKVNRIFPCVCVEHLPNSGDSVYYGMPDLKVAGGLGDKAQFFTPYCPTCGRGGLLQYRSAYLALKEWNRMQLSLWRTRRMNEKEEAIKIRESGVDEYGMIIESADSEYRKIMEKVDEYSTLISEMERAMTPQKRRRKQ